MSVELKTLLIADYAAVHHGAGGKPTVVGIFDTILLNAAMTIADGLAGLPPHYLFAHFTCASMDGLQHSVEFRLLDADAQPIRVHEFQSTFSHSNIPGRGNMLYAVLAVGNFQVPDYGDYTWETSVNGVRLGSTELSVLPISLLTNAPPVR